jgi:hypothetical protein
MTQGRTRLPLAIDDWDRVWADQLIRAIDQNFEAVDANIQNSASITGYYGSFYSTVNQTAAAINTPYAMTFNNTANSNQIAIESNSRIKFKNRGTYNIQFSVQLDQSSGAAHIIYIWFRKNGVDIPYSASEVSIQGTSSQSIPAWNFIVGVLAQDYVEIMWAVDSTAVFLSAVASASFRPAIPSVIATAVSV